jgi:hypothetical protein
MQTKRRPYGPLDIPLLATILFGICAVLASHPARSQNEAATQSGQSGFWDQVKAGLNKGLQPRGVRGSGQSSLTIIRDQSDGPVYTPLQPATANTFASLFSRDDHVFLRPKKRGVTHV